VFARSRPNVNPARRNSVRPSARLAHPPPSPWRNVARHERVRRDPGSLADLDAGQDYRAGPDHRSFTDDDLAGPVLVLKKLVTEDRRIVADDRIRFDGDQLRPEDVGRGLEAPRDPLADRDADTPQ